MEGITADKTTRLGYSDSLTCSIGSYTIMVSFALLAMIGFVGLLRNNIGQIVDAVAPSAVDSATNIFLLSVGLLANIILVLSV